MKHDLKSYPKLDKPVNELSRSQLAWYYVQIDIDEIFGENQHGS